MRLFFVLFIFSILHVQFLLRNIFFDVQGAQYFSFYVPYLYPKDIAVETLLFGICAALAFFIGFIIARRSLSNRLIAGIGDVHAEKSVPSKLANYLLILFGIQVAFDAYVLLTSGFDYQAIVAKKESLSFIFEMRIFALLLLSYLCLNYPMKMWWSSPRARLAWVTIGIYILAAFVLQARSAVFEILAVVMYSYLKWAGDKIRLSYVAFLLVALLMPNLIVLGRLGSDLDFHTLVDGIFSFEYSVLFNNLVSAVISNNLPLSWGGTFTPSLVLLIPSPLRSLLGLDVNKSDLYAQLSGDAGVGGGGFSLLAEMYMNFGWLSLACFVLFGWLLGILVRGSDRSRVNWFHATAPLYYAAFILAFRNDFGVFLKYVVQLWMAAAVLSIIVRVKFRS